MLFGKKSVVFKEDSRLVELENARQDACISLKAAVKKPLLSKELLLFILLAPLIKTQHKKKQKPQNALCFVVSVHMMQDCKNLLIMLKRIIQIA